MTPLRQRMIDDMSVRGLSENTRKSYLGAVAGLARHYRRGPDRIEAREVQDYLLFLHDRRGLSWTSCNTVRHGLRFFYRVTLRLPDAILYVPGAKQPAKQPEILNQNELVRLVGISSGYLSQIMTRCPDLQHQLSSHSFCPTIPGVEVR